jgi:hypothetical protein
LIDQSLTDPLSGKIKFLYRVDMLVSRHQQPSYSFHSTSARGTLGSSSLLCINTDGPTECKWGFSFGIPYRLVGFSVVFRLDEEQGSPMEQRV